MDDDPFEFSPTRRRYLTVTGFAVAGALAGCLGDGRDAEVPRPIALTGHKQCDHCGMVIEEHPGPAGQLFYEDTKPEAHDNPARFCSAWETFANKFHREGDGWTVSSGYLTDYSSVEYELFDKGGSTFISAHLDSEAFGPIEDLFYAVGTDIKGSMGTDLIPFSDEADADAFAEEYGGTVYTADDISRDLIAQL
ncbi:nitrous oxide reductase accessory protein NosL [Haloferax sp. DFSO52]|uniref:nitrous oxide reductase accessory protein NosL n=1 Tax=Haloferax sp. DFSO52 TaxID=3388505 RepID=UPI003A88A8D1